MRTIAEILEGSHVIAVVGLSPREDRDSYRVAKYLQSQGYCIVPVNPQAHEILGQQCYPSLLDIPETIDIVNVFRRPHLIPPVVEEAILKRASTIWMQLGIINQEAAIQAQGQGLDVVMDRCLLLEHQHWTRNHTDNQA